MARDEPKILYQLWCYYERDNKWVMEGFYRTRQDAEKAIETLRDDVETPCMPDWAIVKVEGWW